MPDPPVAFDFSVIDFVDFDFSWLISAIAPLFKNNRIGVFRDGRENREGLFFYWEIYF